MTKRKAIMRASYSGSVFVLLGLMALFLACDPAEDATETPSEIDFDDLFAHERSVPIEGTEEHPVFHLTSLAVRDDRIAVVDREAHRLTLFADDGTLLFQVGQEGLGPGDLQTPHLVAFDNEGRIAVKDHRRSSRLQLFSPEEGTHLQTISEDIVFSGQQLFFDGEGEDQRFLFSTRGPCSAADDQLCVVQKQDISSGALIDRFVKQEAIDPDVIGLPWTLGRDEEKNIYATHYNGGPAIAVFNEEGERVNRFSLDDAPEIATLDYEGAADDFEGFFQEEMQEGVYSNILRIYPIGDDIVLSHRWQGGDNDGARHLSVFNQDGTFRVSTPEIEYRLLHSDGDRFFFVEDDFEVDIGSYVVHEYRYEGVK